MNQIICKGYNSYKELSNILESESPNRILLVTGKNVYFKFGAKEIIGDIINSFNFFFPYYTIIVFIVKTINLYIKFVEGSHGR